jgi:hypothetical protein
MTQEQKLSRNIIIDQYYHDGENPFDFPYSELCYHSLWDLQIPVWQKALKEAGAILGKYSYTESRDIFRQFGDIVSDHNAAKNTGTPEQGFEVLFQLIQFIKKHHTNAANTTSKAD